ncbi:SDR family NAD(P)-dependent oxidoreductase [Thalassococcus sp. BH17M4-6]|uniref:SDR family NAD(P)-dependent oxidoreductase n=1 Tax=Thalassococcus sp. BH17M4-6 TaxID=3413148 RepID=UPI003BE6E26A
MQRRAHDPGLNSLIITGASSGIGRALALEYARPGQTFLLCGRNAERLEATAAAVRKKGAIAELCCVSVRDAPAFAAVITGFDARCPVDGLFFVAGVKAGNQDAIEPAPEVRRVIDVNLVSVILAVQVLLPSLRSRGSARIVLVSSFAALTPRGELLSYSASKAAIMAYGTALRRELRGTGLSVTTVVPGFVDTPMTDRHLGPAPMLVPAEKAARIIRRGVAARRARVVFPRLLAFGVWWQEWLPPRLSDLIGERFRAGVLADDDELGRRGDEGNSP